MKRIKWALSHFFLFILIPNSYSVLVYMLEKLNFSYKEISSPTNSQKIKVRDTKRKESKNSKMSPPIIQKSAGTTDTGERLNPKPLSPNENRILSLAWQCMISQPQAREFCFLLLQITLRVLTRALASIK